MTRIRVLAPLALVLAAALATAAAAQTPAPPPDGTWKERMAQRFQQRYDLSDDQLKAFQAANAKYRDARRQIAISLRQAQTDLRQLALNGADEATLQAKRAEVQQLLGQALDLRVKVLQEVGPVLTQEQRDKFAQPGPTHFRHRRPQPSS